MKTKFEQIQTIRSDGYPKIVEITPSEKFIHGAKDPNFDQPYSKLNKEYK